MISREFREVMSQKTRSTKWQFTVLGSIAITVAYFLDWWEWHKLAESLPPFIDSAGRIVADVLDRHQDCLLEKRETVNAWAQVLGLFLFGYQGVRAWQNIGERDRYSDREYPAQNQPPLNAPSPQPPEKQGLWELADLHIVLNRYRSAENYTLGTLTIEEEGKEFQSLEPGPGKPKEKNKRIQAGVYAVEYETTITPLTQRYLDKYPDWFYRFPEIKNVPGRDQLYPHIGNYPEDTRGCPLLGNTVDLQRPAVLQSTRAYEEYYRIVRRYLDEGKKVAIKIIDHE